MRKAKSLGTRVHQLDDVRVTQDNYLNPGPWFDDLRDFQVYLDPAWPDQPHIKSVPNSRVYGFYASRLMSILRQCEVPYPPEYDVSLADFYQGTRNMIGRALAAGNRVLIAYQTMPEGAAMVKDELFEGLTITEAAERRTTGAREDSAGAYWEYLWRIE